MGFEEEGEDDPNWRVYRSPVALSYLERRLEGNELRDVKINKGTTVMRELSSGGTPSVGVPPSEDLEDTCKK